MPRDKSKDAAAKAVRRQNPEFREKENRARAEKVPLERLAGRILGKKPAARAESRFENLARLIADQKASAQEEETGILAQPTRGGIPLNEDMAHPAGGMIQTGPRSASHPAFLASEAAAKHTKPRDPLGLGIYGKSGVLFRSWYEQPEANPVLSRVVSHIEARTVPDWCLSALAGIAGSAVIEVWELLRDAQEDGADSLLDARPISLPVKVSREGDKVWFEFDPLQLQIGKTIRDDEDLLNLAAESRRFRTAHPDRSLPGSVRQVSPLDRTDRQAIFASWLEGVHRLHDQIEAVQWITNGVAVDQTTGNILMSETVSATLPEDPTKRREASLHLLHPAAVHLAVTFGEVGASASVRIHPLRLSHDQASLPVDVTIHIAAGFQEARASGITAARVTALIEAGAEMPDEMGDGTDPGSLVEPLEVVAAEDIQLSDLIPTTNYTKRPNERPIHRCALRKP